MELFGTKHIFVLLLSLACWIGVPLFDKKYPKYSHIICRGMAILLVITQVIRTGHHIALGIFDFRIYLPIHMCHLANFLAAYMLWVRSFKVFEVIYFWIVIAAIQPVFTPHIDNNIISIGFFVFFVEHTVLVLSALYAAIHFQFTPTVRSLVKSTVWLNILILFLYFFNILFDANYMMLIRKPETVTLLDYLGPWPWYIFTGEALAIAVSYISLLPFWIFRKEGTNV